MPNEWHHKIQSNEKCLSYHTAAQVHIIVQFKCKSQLSDSQSKSFKFYSQRQSKYARVPNLSIASSIHTCNSRRKWMQKKRKKSVEKSELNFRWRHSTAQSLWCVEWERRKKKQNNLVSIRKNQFMSLKKTHSFPIYGKISSILCVQQKMCDACVSVILLLCIMLCFFLNRLLLIPFYWTNLMILKD